jgi:hypothetical protein
MINKILGSMFIAAVFFVGNVQAASLLYNVQVSTLSTGVPEINAAHVWVKNISIYNDSGVAQTVTVYTSTATAGTRTAKITIPIAATSGMYYPLNASMITNAMGNFDVIDIPYMQFRTNAPAGKACYLTIIYGL